MKVATFITIKKKVFVSLKTLLARSSGGGKSEARLKAGK